MPRNPQKNSISLLCLLITILTFTLSKTFAQQKAFPTAYGGGAYASGGRGGNVYHVTNLNDSGDGSLRWALAQARPATIVFDVSGIIELQSSLRIVGNDLTIAGQTAPEGGITITAPPTNINFGVGDAQRVILRYLRVRMQFYGDTAFRVYPGGSSDSEASNLIFDHMSISYAGLQGFTVRGHETHNITFQNGLIAECKTGSLFGDTDPSAAGFSYDNTFRSTLFYNISHRTPNSSSGRADIYNNVRYDWNNRFSVFKTNALVNHFNNYTFTGNKTSLYTQWQDNPRVWQVNGVTNENPSLPPSIYASGNIVQDLFEDPNADNQYLFIEHAYSSQTERVDPALFRATPFPMIGAVPSNIMTAVEASVTVPEDAGTYKYLNADGSVGIYRDPQDTRYVNNTVNDTPESWSCCYDGPNNNRHQAISEQPYADFLASITGTPINVRPNNFYNPLKSEHIPEIWFDANVPDGQDHNGIAPSGYTWLEEYLNGVDSNIPDDVVVDTLEVSPSTANLNVLETIQLTATITTTDGDEIVANQIGEWSTSDPLIATVDSDGIVTGVSTSTVPPYEASVTITYTYTDANDVVSTAISEITVFPEALLASAGIDQQICEGESALLEASGGTSYLWNTGETTAIINVTPNETTTYSVIVTDDFDQSEEVTVTVSVTAIPIADAGIDQTICEGETVTLTATGGTSYLWSTGETTDSIVVSPDAETTYTVEAITNNCSSTDSITIFVNEAPNITITEDLVIVEGSSATLTASGSDNYLWSTDETSESIVVTPIETTIYSVTSLSANGCPSIIEVNVTVVPEVIANAGVDVTICSGETVTLNASGGVAYAWDTGDIGAQLIVSPTETTTYTVNVEDDYGFSDTDSVTIFVNDIPNITLGQDIWLMEGNTATLTANGGTSYLWNTGETTASISVNPITTTSYTVTGFSENGCESSDEILVNVVDELNANAGEDVSICIGNSVTLSASGGITYTWNTGDIGTSPTFSPTETTTYTVTVTDGFGNSDSDDVTVFVDLPPTAIVGEDQVICEGESVTLTAEGGDSYLWNTGDTSSTITVNPITDTVYTVEVFTNSCSDSNSVTVFVNEAPNISVSDDIMIMSGNSTTLLATGGDTYLWNTGETTDTILVSPIDTTTYTVIGFSSANGCQASSSVTVTVIPELIADAGEDVTICYGDSVTLNASGGLTYTWNNGVTGASPTLTPTITTTYTVTVTDAYGNSDTDSVTITVNEVPYVTVSQNITIIEGESTNLVANGADTYLWSTGETSNQITVHPMQTTTYTVTGTTNTCTAQAQVTVTVEELFEASAGTDERICDNNTYEVVLNANQGDSYLWSTGETTQSIIVSPLSTTNYSVTVTQGTQEDTDDVTVYVDPSPNVIIANGDSADILNGDFITLSASGANTYAWNNGATQPNIAVSPSATTTYEVRGYVGDCYDDKQVTVNVFQPVVADAGEDVYICLDEVATLTATGGDEYVWSTGETTQTIEVSPIVTTDYTVTVFNALHFDEASVRVDVDANCVTSEPIDPNDDPLDFSFDVFPNPANDIVNVKLSGSVEVSDINVYDLTGKLIKQVKVYNDNISQSLTTQIDVKPLQQGVYFIRLVDKDRVLSKKLIVN